MTQGYTDHPMAAQQQQEHARLMSMGGMSDHYNGMAPQFSRHNSGAFPSSDNLMSMQQQQSPSVYGLQRAKSPLGNNNNPLSRPASNMSLGLHGYQNQGPSEAAITEAIQHCLREVDLDTVTKKQLKALTEQRLQCQLSVEKRAFLDSQIDFELASM